MSRGFHDHGRSPPYPHSPEHVGHEFHQHNPEMAMSYHHSPEANQNYLSPPNGNHLAVPQRMGHGHHGQIPLSPNSYQQNLSPHSPNSYNRSPAHSPNYHQTSPCLYPTTPEPHPAMTQNYINDIQPMALIDVILEPQLRSALEHLLKERLSERKDYDNTLKRLWIFQHLVEKPCQKCTFLHMEISDMGMQLYKFRIKSKCMANHFRVSGNTPFNWLVRDFCRFHAPHSSDVSERKDLREIYYDEYGLFQCNMTAIEFVELAEKLAGRPTTSGKKRGRSRSMDENAVLEQQAPPHSISLQVPVPKQSNSESSQSFTPAATTSLNKDTTRNRSRLVLEMKVANSTRLVMSGQNLNQDWSKTMGPIELPTFRPELAARYQFGRLDPSLPNQEKEYPYKLFIDDQAISRNHLEIWFDQSGGWKVMDAGSTLGTEITTTRVVDKDGEQRKIPFTTALRSGEHSKLQQGDVLKLSGGIVLLTVLYLKFCPEDTPKHEQSVSLSLFS